MTSKILLREGRDCGLAKPHEDFSPAVTRRDGLQIYCKPCMRVRSTASYRKVRSAAGRTVRERVDVPDGQRRCPDCATVKPLEDFPRNRSGRQGRGVYCKPCHNERGRRALEKVGGSRTYHLKRRYGLSAEDVDAMVEAQGGLCAVCGVRPPEHVDHDHVTGAVRGVLCSGCNQGLGNFRDSATALRRAADYVERTS
jgi:Recombination endonuclease VII